MLDVLTHASTQIAPQAPAEATSLTEAGALRSLVVEACIMLEVISHALHLAAFHLDLRLKYFVDVHDASFLFGQLLVLTSQSLQLLV